MREYVKPMMDSEVFVANQYFSACGDSGTTYLFTCDAGGGAKGDVYVESNGQDGLQRDDRCLTPGLLRYYHACNVTHYADTNDEFLNGYYVPFGGSAQKVIIWTDHGRNVHCTTNLNRDSWETTKS